MQKGTTPKSTALKNNVRAYFISSYECPGARPTRAGTIFLRAVTITDIRRTKLTGKTPKLLIFKWRFLLPIFRLFHPAIYRDLIFYSMKFSLGAGGINPEKRERFSVEINREYQNSVLTESILVRLGYPRELILVMSPRERDNITKACMHAKAMLGGEKPKAPLNFKPIQHEIDLKKLREEVKDV